MQREYPKAPIAGVGAIVVSQRRVLVVRRGREPMKGAWSLPGGVLELGETLLDGLRREVREETGLDVEPVAHVETFDRIARDETDRVRYHYVISDWLCTVTGGELQCGDDADEAVWLLPEELKQNLRCPLDAFALRVVEKALQLYGTQFPAAEMPQ
jgi:ADP-ribose pyrophosphatase YjhB (NUDIX family)